jgi:hypothetical protein
VGVYIVDVNTARLDYAVLTVATDFTSSVDAVSNRQVFTATKAVPTVTGDKKVYVVANPTTNLQNKLGASGATAMNAIAYGSPKADFLTGTLTSMVMSGAYTATSGTLDMNTPISAADAVLPANIVPITIGRNLAKAVLQQGPGYKVIPEGSTTTLTWTLINEAKDAYFIQQTPVAPALYKSLYSEVPASALVPATGASDAYWTNFSGMTGADYIPVLVKGTDAKTAAYADSKYMFENYPAAFHEGNTTAARIKGVFVPAEVFDWDGTAGAPKVNAGFMSGTTFLRSRVDGTYWTETGAADAAAANYNGHSTATFDTDFDKYTNGVGYYTIWVNDGAGNMGVMRNGYYLMQINEVRGPGSPTETVDPIVPVADDTNLGVEIDVLHWDFMKSIQDIQ